MHRVHYDKTKSVPSYVTEILGPARASKGWPYIVHRGKRYYVCFEHPMLFFLKQLYDMVPMDVIIDREGLIWVAEWSVSG